MSSIRFFYAMNKSDMNKSAACGEIWNRNVYLWNNLPSTPVLSCVVEWNVIVVGHRASLSGMVYFR